MTVSRKFKNRFSVSGFSLIELLVVIGIISVIFVVLYTSFQTGLAAYHHSEENLSETREGEIFLIQFQNELRNAIPFFQKDQEAHFYGNAKSIRFPAKLMHFSPDGIEEDLYVIEYEWKNRALNRTEKRMKSELKDRSRESKEKLFKDLQECRFEFMYVNEKNESIWEKEWTNEPYLGLPRGVRLIIEGGIFGGDEKVFEFLIPHGILVQKNA